MTPDYCRWGVRGVWRVARSWLAGELVMSMDAKCPCYVPDIKYCHCPSATRSPSCPAPRRFPFLFSIFSLATFITLAKIMQMSWPKDARPSLWLISSKAKCPLMVMGPKCAFQPCQLPDPWISELSSAPGTVRAVPKRK